MKIRPARLSRAKTVAGASVAAAALAAATLAAVGSSGTVAAAEAPATTPIKHLVVLFPENISFDHYFGTYPFAKNDGTGPSFTAKPNTPIPTNYLLPTASSLADLNPALTTGNPNAVKPFRLTAEQGWTCSQNHTYTGEQSAVHGGAMDQFGNTQAAFGTNPAGDGTAGTSTAKNCNNSITLQPGASYTDTDGSVTGTPGTTTSKALQPLQQAAQGEAMAYYDGNTVTAMWNYAQNYAMSDNNWANNFGPSTVGAMNLVSGQTYGAQYFDGNSTDPSRSPKTPTKNDGNVSAFGQSTPASANGAPVGTIIGDPQPAYDDCADGNHGYNAAAGTWNTTTNGDVVGMTGKNIGDQMNTAGVTWGWFQGGFAPTKAYNGSSVPFSVCGATSPNISHTAGTDYTPHHSPFEYFKSTSNPHHYPGSSGVAIGATDPTNDSTHTGANHNYDLTVFDQAARSGNLPQVSFVKPRYSQDGHPNNSTPIDEQAFLTKTINELEKGPEWSSTAVVITYDDSDGWYDQVAPTILNGSNVTAGANSVLPGNTGGWADDLAVCNSVSSRVTGAEAQVDRCGPSQRVPLLVISPYSKVNYIDHSLESQASVLKFIESNWNVTPLGNGSFDSTPQYGNLMSLFDFGSAAQPNRVLLNSDGVVSVDEPIAVPTVTVTQPGQPGATVTVAPTRGPNSVACQQAKDQVKLLQAKHAKKKRIARARAAAALICK